MDPSQTKDYRKSTCDETDDSSLAGFYFYSFTFQVFRFWRVLLHDTRYAGKTASLRLQAVTCQSASDKTKPFSSYSNT